MRNSIAKRPSTRLRFNQKNKLKERYGWRTFAAKTRLPRDWLASRSRPFETGEGASGLIKAYVKWVDAISEWVGAVAMALIVVMIGVLLLDAVTRNVIRMPLHWCIEVAQFTLAAYYFMGGAMTLKNENHVRMDLVYSHLSRRGQHLMDLITSGCLLFYLGVLLIGGISSLEYAIATNEKRFSIWNPSMIPIKALMVACLVLMILQTISLAFKHAFALKGRPLP
jgi:TRAP-type mannitol/chloroaromatic compound transport system permease small subunit